MAIAPALHTIGNNGTNASSFTTASISPTANAIQLAIVVTRDPTTITVPTLSGGGMTTWTREGTGVAIDFAGTGNDARIDLFRALQASPTSGAITIDYSGDTQRGCAWLVLEATGVTTTGTNGSDAVRQAVFDGVASYDSAPNIGLSTLQDSSSYVIGVFSSVASAGSTSVLPTIGSGYTSLGGDNSDMAPGTSVFGEYRANVVAVDCAIAAGDEGWLGVAIELAVATTFYPTAYYQYVTRRNN